jgi:hypothetical protein
MTGIDQVSARMISDLDALDHAILGVLWCVRLQTEVWVSRPAGRP